MKKIFISVLLLSIFLGITQTAAAQKDKVSRNKEEEVIIRNNGDKDQKLTLEMKGDDVLINGKPLSEFKDDDVSVMKREKIMRDGNEFFIRPGEGNNTFFNDDSDNEATRPFLGVTTGKDEKGVKIIKVLKASGAEKAGLKEDDIITMIDSKKINNPEELMDVVKSYKPKDEVKIYYEREGKSNETKAVLGERKESIARSFNFNQDEIPGMNEKMFKNFNLHLPPTPGQPFNKFWMVPNKKLGVRIEDTENDAGVKIAHVEEGSVAGKAGLKKDDIITEVNGKKIENVGDAREEVLETDKNIYTIKAKRNGSIMNFEIKIPKKPNSADL